MLSELRNKASLRSLKPNGILRHLPHPSTTVRAGLKSCPVPEQGAACRGSYFAAGILRGFTAPQSALLKAPVASCVHVNVRGLVPCPVLATKRIFPPT